MHAFPCSGSSASTIEHRRIRGIAWGVLVSCIAVVGPMGCGSSPDAAGSTGSAQLVRAHLDLALPDSPVTIQAPTTADIFVVVIGAQDNPVSITSPDLPAFVTISGSTLQVAPTIKDAGDYTITLVATAGTLTGSGTLQLDITRVNTPPMWLPVPTVSGDSIQAFVCDAEGDDITLEAEVEPAGTPFVGQPTYSETISFSTTQPLSYELPNDCANFEIQFVNLAPGTYHVALYAVDSLGAAEPYGWVDFGNFSI